MKVSQFPRGFGRLFVGALLALNLALLSACGGSDGTTGGSTPPPPLPPPVTTGAVNGQVVSAATGLPVAGASVSAAGLSATTAADGRYTLAAAPAGPVTLVIAAPDFTRGVANATVVAGVTSTASARLTPVGTRQQVAAASGALVSLPGSPAQVVLPANGIVDSSGAAFIGNLTVALTALNPAQDADNMPGELATRAGDGSVRPIESFGAIAVTLTDSAGNRLNLAAGRTATIRIPLSTRSEAPPATVPLYYLNESTGLWVREGSATLAGTAPEQYYEGTVSHFTFWNADDVFNTITVSGCVRDSANQAVAGAQVRSDGLDYTGRASAVTDAAGNFSVAMRRGGRASIEGSLADGRVSNSVIAGPSDTPITLPACLVLGNGAPVFVVQPQPQGATEGGFVVFQALARGQPVLRYKWQRNGVDIVGATATTLLVDPVAAGDNGAVYRAVASNAVGIANSDGAVLTVAALPPLILASPQDLTVLAGAAASFSVQTAAQGAPLQYQWRRNGTDIAGATAATYSLATTSLADSGARFSVRVSNSVAAVVSAEATLTVNAVAVEPSITQQPAAATVTAGQSAQFSVLAGGTAPLSYQWRRDGQAIAGATAASYTLVNTLVADSGARFSVLVSNSAGQLSSADAVLTVNAPPQASGRFLLAGAGPWSSGSVVFANGSQTFDSPALLAVSVAAPAGGPVTVEAAGAASQVFAQLLQAQVQGGQISQARSRLSLLFKGGRLHIIDHEPASGVPVSRPISTLTSGQVCGAGGLPSFPDFGRNTLNDLALAVRSWIFLEAPGLDGTCGTADDTRHAVRADMSASDAPLVVNFSPLLEIWGADGSLQGVLVREGQQIRRLNAQLGSAQTIFTLAAPNFSFDETAGFGTSFPGTWVFVDNGRLYGYALDGSSAAPTLLYTFTQAERERGNWAVASQGQNAYVAVDGGAGSSRLLRVTTALAATEVATGPAGFTYIVATPTRVLFRTSASLVSVPLGAGDTVTLASAASGFGSFEPIVVSGETVWFAQNDSSTEFATANTVRVMQSDGANPQTFVGSAIVRSLAAATTTTTALQDENSAAVLLAQGFTNEGWYAGATLRTVDALTRQTLQTLGTVPSIPARSNVFSASIDPLQLGQAGLFGLFNLDREDLAADLLFINTGGGDIVLIPGGGAMAAASGQARALALRRAGVGVLRPPAQHSPWPASLQGAGKQAPASGRPLR